VRRVKERAVTAEKALNDTKEQIKGKRREVQQASTLQDEAAIQPKLQEFGTSPAQATTRSSLTREES